MRIMRPPFPGMDPWLENPALWPDVHSRLITSIADELAPLLDSAVFRGCGVSYDSADGLDVERVYKPDVSIHATESRAAVREHGVALLERPEVRTYNVSVADRRGD